MVNALVQFIGRFTKIEKIAVVIIVCLVWALALMTQEDNPDEMRVASVNADINTIVAALKIYKLDNGFYPSTEQGLLALAVCPAIEPIPAFWKTGGYIDGGKAPQDPWGRDYVYTFSEETDGFTLTCLGADGYPGGSGYDADISSYAN